MKIRLARCSHEYEVPDEFLAGRRRLKCDGCLRLDDLLSPGQLDRMIASRRGRAASAGRLGRAELDPRKATCGHPVPYHPGPARRRCDGCTPTYVPRSKPEPRRCEQCAKVFAPTYRAARFCSHACSSQKYSPICITAGCLNPHRAKGLCSTCYNRVRIAAGGTKYPRQTCPTCSSAFAPTRQPQTYCSLLCRSGGAFVGIYTDSQRANCREKQRRRRAQKREVVSERFSDVEIYERDGWRCGVCRRTVNRRLVWPHPMSASLDHIIPISEEGSSHTRANVRLTHLGCNIARGNRGGNEQLLLIG